MAGKSTKKLTETEEGLERIEKFINYLRAGNYIETACRASGIAKKTFYNWMEKARNGDPECTEIARRVDQAMALAETNMVGKVTDAADLDAKFALEWLSRIYPDRWGKKTQVDIDHKIATVTSTIIEELKAVLPPAQFRSVMLRLQKVEEAEVVPLLEAAEVAIDGDASDEDQENDTDK